jgi:hypothetical protein
MARTLVLLSMAIFTVTGAGYLLVPGALLSVVGIPSTPTADFLLRTLGAAFVAVARLLWGVREAPAASVRVALSALAAYYFISSAVDFAAYVQGIVGVAFVPSAITRVVLGVLCVVAMLRLPR